MNLADLDGFAVDLGGTKIAAARIEAGQIVARLQEATDGAAGTAAQADHIAALLARLGHSSGAPTGVAVTGRVTRDGHWRAVNAGTLPSITGASLGAALRQRLGPVALMNDAAAAALAEARFGAGSGIDTFAYITVSTGIGGGLVLNGRLVESANGLAGHIGFVSSRHADGSCGSGRFATVESVAGGRAIAAAAAGRAADAREVLDQARAGADWAEAIVARSAAAVATLAADLTAALGLERIAVGGSIGLAPGYLDRVRRALAGEPELFRPELVAAALGQNSALLGALAAARA